MDSFVIAMMSMCILFATPNTDATCNWPWSGCKTRNPYTTNVPERYCTPEQSCWPSHWELMLLKYMLTGTVVLPTDASYADESPVDSLYFKREPAMIVKVASTCDVQKVLKFVREFNIRLTIYSTGHEYNGRSTADGSLQMSMVNMDRIDIDLSDPASDTGASVTVETGINFGRIYEAVAEVGKVVVGGYEPTVGPGGYTAGGGHGPVSRSLGLAVDNLIAATMVLSNGDVAHLKSTGTTVVTRKGEVISSQNTDLFWAIRGGGGGTFGVIIDLTYKLHDQPPQVVQYEAYYPLVLNNEVTIGKGVIELIHQLLPSLPNEWAGLIIISGLPFPIPIPVPGLTALVAVNLLHYGPWDQPTMKAIQPLVDFYPEARILSRFTNHSSIWSYAQTFVPYPTAHRGYIAGSWLTRDKLTPELIDLYVSYVQSAPVHLNGRFNLCAEVLLGGIITTIGNMKDKYTSVSDDYRKAILQSHCFMSWNDPSDDSAGFELGKAMGEAFYTHSAGVYLNEPAYYLPSWKTDFWGDNYERLLSLKKFYDPNNVFYCHHCIGDETETGNWRRRFQNPIW